MAELAFDDLSFEQENGRVKVNFLKLFYAHLQNEELRSIGEYEVKGKAISFPKVAEQKAQRRFNSLLSKSFEHLHNRISNKPAFYIHKNSGIPLIGTNYFGVIDRGTNTLEIKPLTSCNISCIFCSVDEGPHSRRKVDFVIEKDYLVQEFRKVVEYKGVDDIDAHINSQGEPTLYGDLVGLVEDVMAVPGVATSSIDTNGLMLNKQLIDELAEAGLSRIHLSLHALDQEMANKLAGFPYNVKRVLEMAAYACRKMDLIITPVWLPRYNDLELPKLAKFAEEIGAGKSCPPIGIQNFLPYKMGRNPVKEASFDEFFRRMRELESEFGVKLLYTEGFNMHPVKELPKPFKKGQIVQAEIRLPGRIGNEKLAVAKGRVISVLGCNKKQGMVRVRIRRTKHNIFGGEVA
jgi:uncharacterized Fe-S cluster-containing radical SAM superfamily enzyme